MITLVVRHDWLLSTCTTCEGLPDTRGYRDFVEDIWPPATFAGDYLFHTGLVILEQNTTTVSSSAAVISSVILSC